MPESYQSPNFSHEEPTNILSVPGKVDIAMNAADTVYDTTGSPGAALAYGKEIAQTYGVSTEFGRQVALDAIDAAVGTTVERYRYPGQ